MAKLYRRKDGGNWYADYTGADGTRQQKSTGTTSKTTAQRILERWQIDAAAQRHGVAANPKQTLSALLNEYLQYIGNGTDEHLSLTRQRIQRILAATDATTPKQLDRVQVELCVQQFQTLGRKATAQTISKRSQSHYLTAVKGFTRWLTDLKHVYVRDPLAGLKRPNFAASRRLVRRYLLPDEWPWLAQTPNATLYETAIQTGLRASELRSIQPSHLKSDHILLPPSATKNKRQAKQYIGAELRGKLADCLPFELDQYDAAVVLRSDLATARELWEASLDTPGGDFLLPTNDAGETLDFHSLRHTCGAWLAIQDVNPKIIQAVMRHSTITLTLDTYGHLMPGAEADAAKQLSSMLRVTDLTQA